MPLPLIASLIVTFMMMFSVLVLDKAADRSTTANEGCDARIIVVSAHDIDLISSNANRDLLLYDGR